MTTAGTSANSGLSAYDSGYAAARWAIEAVQSSAEVLLLYTSADYPIDEVLRGAVAVAPDVPILGNTSFTGVVTSDGQTGGTSGFTGALASGEEELSLKGIADRIGEAADALVEATEGVPSITEFTFGEYGFEDSGYEKKNRGSHVNAGWN